MENKFTPEQIEKAKECRTVAELLNLAKENGVEITEAEATNYFAKLNPENCELADSELESVSGGWWTFGPKKTKIKNLSVLLARLRNAQI